MHEVSTVASAESQEAILREMRGASSEEDGDFKLTERGHQQVLQNQYHGGEPHTK